MIHELDDAPELVVVARRTRGGDVAVWLYWTQSQTTEVPDDISPTIFRTGYSRFGLFCIVTSAIDNLAGWEPGKV